MQWARLLLCTIALFAAGARAGSLSVMPVVVALSADKVRDSIVVTNRASQFSTVHVDVMSWMQSEGQDVFQRTTDVLVNPEVFTLAAGQAQVLRLGWRGVGNADVERTYRIFLREVPGASGGPVPSAPVTSPPVSVNVLLELRIPIYVAPRKPDSSLVWQARRVGRDHVDVHLRNQGNVHAVVHDLQLITSSGHRFGSGLGVNSAVLAGQERVWRLPQPNADGQDIGVEVRVNRDRHRLTLDP